MVTRNLYRNDRPIIGSDKGQFWRCKHGLTMFSDAICVPCALAAPVAFYRRKVGPVARQPRAWLVISRYGQITSRPRVHVGLYGKGRGCIGLYTYLDDPPGNATAESNAYMVARLVGIPVIDERRTPWNVPRDGMSELTDEEPQRRDEPTL